MDMNHIYTAWVIAGLGVFIGFVALYSATETRKSIDMRLDRFFKNTKAELDGDMNEIKDKVNDLGLKVNEQLNKLRLRHEDEREAMSQLKKDVSKLRARLTELDHSILPKYKK